MTKKQVVMGIDIGGTNTVFGLVDKYGKIFYRGSMDTRGQDGAQQLFDRLFDEFNKEYQPLANDFQLCGVGIGAPNANYYKKTVENPPNLNWGVVNVDKIIEQFVELPMAITNDANAAALGEMMYGAARGMKNFIQITLGTGLGSGIVTNGKMVYGADGFAGEIAHTTICKNDRQCGCGKRGCLETYASATGIKRTAFALLAQERTASELRDLSFNDMTSRIIFEAALRNDPIALEAFEITGKILGEALANSVAHLSPEAIILFGGLASAGELITKPTKKYMEKNLFHAFRNNVEILLSALPDADAALLGAAALIWGEVQQNLQVVKKINS